MDGWSAPSRNGSLPLAAAADFRRKRIDFSHSRASALGIAGGGAH
jgi:hypothetical protein